MKSLIHILAGIVLMLGSGCSSGIFYYETGKVSITLEGKATNIAQPVSGNIGIKHTVVAVVPSKKPVIDNRVGKAKDVQDDAVSMISFFDVHKATGGKVTVESFFITGKAATELNVEQTAAAAIAIARTGDQTAIFHTVLRHVVDDLENRAAADNKSKKYMKALNDLDELLPAKFKVNSYTSQRAGAVLSLVVNHEKDKTTLNTLGQSGINLAITYAATLQSSIEEIDKAIAKGSTVLYQANAIDTIIRAGLLGEKKNIEDELKRINRIVFSSARVKEAFDYWAYRNFSSQ